MKNIIFPIIIGLYLLLFCSSCQPNEQSNQDIKWESLIKEMEIVLESSQSDTTKYQQIKRIFKEYQVEMKDYQDFYQKYVEKNPRKNISFLGRVEEQLADEMRKATQQTRKLSEEKRKAIDQKRSGRFQKIETDSPSAKIQSNQEE